MFRRPYNYCSLCFSRLNRSDASRCGECGEKTTAIGLFEKVLKDDSFTKKEKTELRFCALLHIAVILIDVIVCFVMIAAGWTMMGGDRLRMKTVLTIMAVIQAVGLIPCLLVLLKKEWALPYMLFYSEISFFVASLHLNIVAGAAILYLVVQTGNIIKKAEGKSADSRRKVERARQHIPDKSRWECTACGYVNGSESGECRSCGRYR